MECEAGRCKTSTPFNIFIVTPSLEGSPAKAKEAPSPHEVRLAQLDTNPVFRCLGVPSKFQYMQQNTKVALNTKRAQAKKIGNVKITRERSCLLY